MVKCGESEKVFDKVWISGSGAALRGGRIVLIFGWAGQKVAILVWSSENVLILGMARVRSGDFMYRSGFVSNPVDKTLICGDFLFNPYIYIS